MITNETTTFLTALATLNTPGATLFAGGAHWYATVPDGDGDRKAIIATRRLPSGHTIAAVTVEPAAGRESALSRALHAVCAVYNDGVIPFEFVAALSELAAETGFYIDADPNSDVCAVSVTDADETIVAGVRLNRTTGEVFAACDVPELAAAVAIIEAQFRR